MRYERELHLKPILRWIPNNINFSALELAMDVFHGLITTNTFWRYFDLNFCMHKFGKNVRVQPFLSVETALKTKTNQRVNELPTLY